MLWIATVREMNPDPHLLSCTNTNWKFMNDLNLRIETLKSLQKNKENTSGYVEAKLPNEDTSGVTCNEKVSVQHFRYSLRIYKEYKPWT